MSLADLNTTVPIGNASEVANSTLSFVANGTAAVPGLSARIVDTAKDWLPPKETVDQLAQIKSVGETLLAVAGVCVTVAGGIYAAVKWTAGKCCGRGKESKKAKKAKKPRLVVVAPTRPAMPRFKRRRLGLRTRIRGVPMTTDNAQEEKEEDRDEVDGEQLGAQVDDTPKWQEVFEKVPELFDCMADFMTLRHSMKLGLTSKSTWQYYTTAYKAKTGVRVNTSEGVKYKRVHVGHILQLARLQDGHCALCRRKLDTISFTNRYEFVNTLEIRGRRCMRFNLPCEKCLQKYVSLIQPARTKYWYGLKCSQVPLFSLNYDERSKAIDLAVSLYQTDSERDFCRLMLSTFPDTSSVGKDLIKLFKKGRHEDPQKPQNY